MTNFNNWLQQTSLKNTIKIHTSDYFLNANSFKKKNFILNIIKGRFVNTNLNIISYFLISYQNLGFKLYLKDFYLQIKIRIRFGL